MDTMKLQRVHKELLFNYMLSCVHGAFFAFNAN
jgi:hypothetical protein